MQKIFFHTSTAILLLLLSLPAKAQTFDPQSDTWVCVDELGRNVASSDDGATCEIDEKALVGMFYYVWHGQHGTETKDITRLLEANPENPAFGEWQTFHWGGKPALGYYTGGTAFIVARHMQMLVDAGIDFYFFDVTNAYTYVENVKVVMKEIDRRTALGLRSPKLAFMTHSSSAATVTNLYNSFYKNSAYDKYWFLWEGKPLMLVENGTEANLSDEVKARFTFRYSWAWDTGEKKWSWLAYYPQKPGTLNGTPEQVSVSTAMHPSSKIGKSYHGGKQPAYDKYGLCKETPEGLFFAEQWQQAHKLHPPVVMITQWNEWMAQRFHIESTSQFSLVRPGATAKIGESYFVDVYNQEFNRDIEPSSEPLIRDNYYLQMVSNVRKYRGVRPIPVPTEAVSIQSDGSFSQWEAVTQTFLDEPGDAYYTSTTAQSSYERLRKPNDFVTLKVTKDADSLYFYVATQANISALATNNKKVRWMTLYINRDLDYSNGWYGYDLMVSNDGEQLKIYQYADAWTELGAVCHKVEGREMMLSLNRKQIGMQADTDFDFKWIDDIERTSTDVLDFISKGDVAPNGRFNYRYKGSRLITQKLDGVYFLQSAFSPWQDATVKSLCAADGQLTWGTQEETLSFLWRLTSNANGTYSAQNIATRTFIGPLQQPALNGDGCGSAVTLSSVPSELNFEMAPNGAFFIHEGGICTAHGKANQSLHVNGHNTSAGSAPQPAGVTAWLDDVLGLSTWILSDAQHLSYRAKLDSLLDAFPRDYFPQGETFGSYLPEYVAAFQQARDNASETLETESDIFADTLLGALTALQDAICRVQTLGYVPMPDGYYYITNAALWDDFTTKALCASTNYMNCNDFVKGKLSATTPQPLCIFRLQFEADTQSYSLFSPSLNRYAGRWSSSQLSMVAEKSLARLKLEPAEEGNVRMFLATETNQKCFYPKYRTTNTYTTTGKTYRIYGAEPQPNGLSLWKFIPTQAPEENPYVQNDTLNRLFLLCDANPERKYPSTTEGGEYATELVSQFRGIRAEAEAAMNTLSGNYTAHLAALQAAIDDLEGHTQIDCVRTSQAQTPNALFDTAGRKFSKEHKTKLPHGVYLHHGQGKTKKVVND